MVQEITDARRQDATCGWCCSKYVQQMHHSPSGHPTLRSKNDNHYKINRYKH